MTKSDQLETSAPRSNGKTAWVLVSIALVFFAGVIAKRWIMG
jgi:hypothetical protein